MQGTTDYVAARVLSRLLTEADGLEQVAGTYRETILRTDAAEEVIWHARHQVMTHDPAAELWSLYHMFSEVAAADPLGVEFGPEKMRGALLEFIAAFPRYRTYMAATGVGAADAALLRNTVGRAVRRLNSPGALPYLAEVLSRPDPATALFRLRMRQVTGSAVAKSAEDTAFYREVRLLCANKVGGDPDDDPLVIDGFHRAMERRAERMPHGLTLTSSHDTKRSEDARMRIAAIARDPDGFEAWYRIDRGFAPPRLTANLVWYIAQTCLDLEPGDGDQTQWPADHIVKALRAAKSERFRTASDLALGKAAQDYVRCLARHFARHAPEVEPILAAAERLTLIQVALKLTIPGIPDIYQGCELPFHALSDPDNRRAVDFDLRERALDDAGGLQGELHRVKFDLTQHLLELQRDVPGLFLLGGYDHLAASNHICAFMRSPPGQSLTVAVDCGGESGAPDKVLPLQACL